MSIYRQIHTSIWKDEWFIELEAQEKLLFIYLFSNASTSVSGIYPMPLKVLAFESGLDREFIRESLDRFAQAGKVYYQNGYIWVVNLRRYNATDSVKVRERIARDLENIPDCTLKEQYFDLYPADRPSKEELRAASPHGPRGNSRQVQGRVRKELENERGQKCEACGKAGYVELHHIIPFRAGGTLANDNCLLLCSRCHSLADIQNNTKYPIPQSKYPISNEIYLSRAEQGTGTGNREQEQETESVKVASSKRDSNLKVAAQSAAPRPSQPKKTNENGKPPESETPKEPRLDQTLFAITMKKLGRKPETDSERGKWNRGIKELVAAGVSGEEYERLLDRAEREWGPGCDRNPMAIAPNLSSLRAPPKAERDKAEEAARVKAEAEYRRADKAMLDELAQKYGGNLCNR